MRFILAGLCASLAVAGQAAAQTATRVWTYDAAQKVAVVRGVDRGVLRVMCRPDRAGLKVRVSSGAQLRKGEEPNRVAFVAFDGVADDVRIWRYSATRAELTRDWAVEQFMEGATAAKQIAVSVVTDKGEHLHFKFGTENFVPAVEAAKIACEGGPDLP